MLLTIFDSQSQKKKIFIQLSSIVNKVFLLKIKIKLIKSKSQGSGNHFRTHSFRRKKPGALIDIRNLANND